MNEETQFFRSACDQLGLSQGCLANLMLLEDTKQNREQISRKYRGDVGVTKRDLAMLRLLIFLSSQGYDLKNMIESDVLTVKFSLLPV